MNARKREPLTDFSWIDRRYDLIVTKKNEDLSHQRHKIRNCHWNLFLHSPSYISHFLVTNTIMAHEIEFFQSYFISDLYLIYILNDFKKSNVCLFCYNSFLYKETVKHSIVWLTMMMQVTIHQIANLGWTLNSDHGLFHDLNHRRALILINPDISLTGPLETKPKEKQKNFQKMKQILKCRLQSGSHFVSQQH